MSEHKPGERGVLGGRPPGPAPQSPGPVGADDALAARLLAAQRMLAALSADSEVRIGLQLRFIAICTALKLPGASKVRGVRRLDRLITDAERAQSRH